MVVCCEWFNFVGAVYVQNTEEVCKVVHVEVSGKYNYFRSWDADVLNSCSLALRGSLVSRTTPSSDTNSPSTSPHVRLSLFLLLSIVAIVLSLTTFFALRKHRLDPRPPLHATHLHPHLLPLPQPPHRPRTRLEPDRRLAWQRR